MVEYVLCQHEEYVMNLGPDGAVRKCYKCTASSVSAQGEPAPLPPWRVVRVR